MGTGTTAGIELLLRSISQMKTTESGERVMDFDPEDIRYSLLKIDSDNFAAFLRSYKDVLTLCSEFSASNLPNVSYPVSIMIQDFAKNTLTSITGKSSENGWLLKLLFRDIIEERISYEGIPQQQSLMQRLKSRQEAADKQVGGDPTRIK